MSPGIISRYTRWFEDLSISDVDKVGGKNASLGEMIRALKNKNIRIPDGFATTAEAYWRFIDTNQLREPITALIEQMRSGRSTLEHTGHAIRKLILNGAFPLEIQRDLLESYRELSQKYQVQNVDVAVRSSATAEDLPSASFAGQQETYLNISGSDELLAACRKCFASLFTDRAISYREKQGFDHMKVALSVGVQKMVRSDKAGAGVMFSLDTETGFPNVVIINAAWGLGENVVKGQITPDQYDVFKPLLNMGNLNPIIGKTLGSKSLKMIYSSEGNTKNIDTPPDEQNRFVLSDPEILQLARWAVDIEEHYQKPMDMEWAKDGESGELYIVQARPETVHSQKEVGQMKTYILKQKGKPLVTGLSIGEAIATGKACVVHDPKHVDHFQPGDILITEMTDPDWVPLIQKASAIVTDSGGRTSHAAIISREYGIPAIIGTGNATRTLKNGQDITVSCAEGDEGFVYGGILAYETKDLSLDQVPETKTRVMLNIASPAGAFRWWRLPNEGIGLARMEFIINNIIKIHPMALIQWERLEDAEARQEIEKLTQGYPHKPSYFVDKLAYGIAKIAASQFPHQVIVRLSDFKTNEYADLIGGRQFEIHEANPMIGFRGASRYYHPRYRAGFDLECQAIKRVRDEMGLSNVTLMIPFCRTVEEADQVLAALAENGLQRGKNHLQIYVMAEIPSNIILAEEFAKRFDGFSIGSNDLTQLVLGIDRDSAELAPLFDERNEAVKRMIHMLIQMAHQVGSKVGICGQAPSDYPDFAEFLVQEGIDSISLNPGSVIPIKHRIAKMEQSRASS